MERDFVCQRPCGLIGTVKSISTRSHLMLVVTSSTIVPTPPSNGSITSSSVDSEDSSSSVSSSTTDSVSGSALFGSQPLSTSLDPSWDSVSMMPTPMTTSTSLTERRHLSQSPQLFYALMDCNKWSSLEQRSISFHSTSISHVCHTLRSTVYSQLLWRHWLVQRWRGKVLNRLWDMKSEIFLMHATTPVL